MSRHVQLFGIRFDALAMHEVVEQLWGWVDAGDGRCQYVVTPNVDHVVMFDRDARLRAAYGGAGLVVVDGTPLVWASRLLRRRLPERVAGSDLVPALLASAAGRELRVYLLGAAPGVADRAADRIEAGYPGVSVVGTCSPPIGFEHEDAQNEAILASIAEAQPDVLLVGLGAPKQELWVSAHREAIRAPVALCIGATIDFLAGEKRRAPVWMRKTGLEWTYRVLCEPRRLWRRYAHDARVFPRLVWRQWREQRAGRAMHAAG